MKSRITIFVLGWIMIGCTVSKKPEFIQVNKINITDASFKNFTIEAKLQFRNKNDVGGTLQAKDIQVLIDSIPVATINSKVFTVPKRTEFEIPLKVTIPFEKVFNDNKQSLLNNIMNVLTSKKIMVNYNGFIRYKLGAFHYDYPISYKQEVLLSKGK